MKGKFSILRFGPIGDVDPEVGTWTYDNGVIIRGLLRKKSLNLKFLLKNIEGIPDGIYRTFIADSNASSSFYWGGLLSGGNAIVGMIARSSKIKKITRSELFQMNFKDGRVLLASTDKDILKELISLSGVMYIPSKETEKTIALK